MSSKQRPCTVNKKRDTLRCLSESRHFSFNIYTMVSHRNSLHRTSLCSLKYHWTSMYMQLTFKWQQETISKTQCDSVFWSPWTLSLFGSRTIRRSRNLLGKLAWAPTSFRDISGRHSNWKSCWNSKSTQYKYSEFEGSRNSTPDVATGYGVHFEWARAICAKDSGEFIRKYGCLAVYHGITLISSFVWRGFFFYDFGIPNLLISSLERLHTLLLLDRMAQTLPLNYFC